MSKQYIKSGETFLVSAAFKAFYEKWILGKAYIAP